MSEETQMGPLILEQLELIEKNITKQKHKVEK